MGSTALHNDLFQSNPLPLSIYCACCPTEIAVYSTTFFPNRIEKMDKLLIESAIEFLEDKHPFHTPDLREFKRGVLLRIRSEGSYASLHLYTLPRQKTPAGYQRCLLPRCGLEIGKVIWICFRCEEIFKGHIFNVGQYLAVRQRASAEISGKLHFKVSASC